MSAAPGWRWPIGACQGRQEVAIAPCVASHTWLMIVSLAGAMVLDPKIIAVTRTPFILVDM